MWSPPRPFSPRAPRALALAALLLAACDDDVTGLGVSDVAGTYEMTAFTITDGETTTDYIAEGASVTLELHESATTTGSGFIPDAAEGGGDLVWDLEGTWRLRDGVVTLDHDADTFLRDVPFVADGNTLVGDLTLGSGSRIQATLTKE